jgi:CDP-diacylglycerol--glycerol-3-phosphate 3-phosphatidyltransferase
MSGPGDATERGEGAAAGTPGAHRGEHGFLTVSNFLSLIRIPLGVGFLVVRDTKGLATIVALGAASDLLDGFIARVTGTRTEIGALLDPFCDRVFMFLGLVSFLPTDRLDWAGFVILILRDLFTGGVFVVSLLTGQSVPFHSRPGGKVTTAFQVAALFALVFAPGWVKLPIVLVGVASVYAILDYGTAAMRRAAEVSARPGSE